MKADWPNLIFLCRAVRETAKLPFLPWQFGVGFVLGLQAKEQNQFFVRIVIA